MFTWAHQFPWYTIMFHEFMKTTIKCLQCCLNPFSKITLACSISRMVRSVARYKKWSSSCTTKVFWNEKSICRWWRDDATDKKKVDNTEWQFIAFVKKNVVVSFSFQQNYSEACPNSKGTWGFVRFRQVLYFLSVTYNQTISFFFNVSKQYLVVIV